MSARLTGSLLALGAALMWGTAWVATGVALREFSPEAVAAWRGAGSLLLVAGLLAARASRAAPLPAHARSGEHDARRPGRLLRYALLAMLGGPWFVLGMTLAVELAGATVSAFVAGLYPVVAAVAAPLLLPERPSRAAVLGLLAAFLGVLLLAGFDPLGVPPLGVAVAISVAVFFGLFLLLVRRWSSSWGLSPLHMTAANFAVLTLVALPLVLVLSPHSFVPAASVAGWLAVGWLIVGPGVLANLFVLGSVRRLPAHESSAYLMLAPLTAWLLAGVLLGEQLAAVQALGAVLVLAGIAAATLPLSRIVERRYGPGAIR
ncbi:MAG TPA: DMT family transporter [Candidatus Limnocylindria bacterium]|nr:DMT family transporter [Candidatus Limnocylindria bacterium]